MVGSLEKKILIELYKSSKGLQDKTLANRFSLKVSYLLDFIDKFTSNDYISYDGLVITIQENGIKYLISKKLVSVSTDRFNNIPKWMLGEKIQVNKPYIPYVESIDLKDFRNDDDSHN